jgi:hypothetical protein
VVKGLPSDVAEQYFRDGAARFWRALSIREALTRKQQPTEWIETYRGPGAITPKRWAVAPSDGSEPSYYRSEPFRVEELAEIAGAERGSGAGMVLSHGRTFPAKPPRKPPSPGHIAQ